MSISELDNCPVCDSLWRGQDILECFKEMRATGSKHYVNMTDEELLEVVSHYGYTLENPKCFRRIVGIEDPRLYDGVSWWECPDCKTRWDRWTNKIVPTKHKD